MRWMPVPLKPEAERSFRLLTELSLVLGVIDEGAFQDRMDYLNELLGNPGNGPSGPAGAGGGGGSSLSTSSLVLGTTPVQATAAILRDNGDADHAQALCRAQSTMDGSTAPRSNTSSTASSNL